MLTMPDHKVPFNILNYWRMYKAKGIRLPFYYFFQAHIFDLINGTDTHKWLPKKYIKSHIDNFEHSGMYMASWTSEIKKMYKKLHSIMGDKFEEYTFIDIGCGKGKVGIIWRICLNKSNKNQRIIGVDLLENLITVARKNHAIMFGTNGEYITQDITKINPNDYGNKFILYMYNPFDDFIMHEVLNKFSNFETIILYNNPVHKDLFNNKLYSKIFEFKGFHGNLDTICFSNN